MSKHNRAKPSECRVCGNSLINPTVPHAPQYILPDASDCPYCRTPLLTTGESPQLADLLGFDQLQPVPFDAPAAVYRGVENGKDLFVTLLPSTHPWFPQASNGMLEHMATQVDPGAKVPQVVRAYPFRKAGEIVFASTDWYDGKSLDEWFQQDGELALGDILHIMLQAAHALKFVQSEFLGQHPTPGTTLVDDQGRIHFNCFLRGMCDFFNRPFWRDAVPETGLPDLESLRSRMRKVTSHRYGPPHSNLDLMETDPPGQDQLPRIYRLGCLFVELIQGEKLRYKRDEARRVENLGHRPIDLQEVSLKTPKRVFEIIRRMLRDESAAIYESLSEVVDDLLALRLDTPSVQLATINQQAARLKRSSETDKLWIPRTAGTDFRKVRWGMSKQEVDATEPFGAQLAGIGPGVCSNYQGRTLGIYYMYDQTEAGQVCVGAKLLLRRESLSNPIAYTSGIKSRQSRVFQDSIQQIIDDPNNPARDQLMRSMEVLKKMGHIMGLPDELPVAEENSEQELETLLAEVKEHTDAGFDTLLQLLKSEYGEPEFPEITAILANPSFQTQLQESIFSEQQMMEAIRVAQWKNDRSLITLVAQPDPPQSFGCVYADITSIEFAERSDSL